MRRCTIITVVLAVTGVASGPAAAQQIGVGFGGVQPTLESTIPVQASGQLTVQFHGDAAAGCARWGLCGYSGTVTWRPAPAASLVLDRTLGPHPRTSVIYLPSFNNGPQLPGGVTTADVTLQGGASHCVDAASTGQFLDLPVRAGRATVALGGATPPLLATRCAGPRDPDVIPALLAPSVPVAGLSRGRQTISLATSRPLAAHGFTGTISSTIVLRLGTPGRAVRSAPTPPPRRGGTRVRQLDVGYRATISGSVVEQVRGDANPLLCAPLASCGLTGTVTLTPHGSGHAELTAQQLASRPQRTLLAALGLGPGSGRGVGGSGSVQWRSGGAVTADLTQGGEQCRDAARLSPGGLIMVAAHGRLTVSYSPGALGGTPDVTRCPGPLPANAAAASGTVPVSMLGARTTQIRLSTGSTTRDDGYSVRFVPDLTLTLTRTTRRSRILTLPPGVPLS